MGRNQIRVEAEMERNCSNPILTVKTADDPNLGRTGWYPSNGGGRPSVGRDDILITRPNLFHRQRNGRRVEDTGVVISGGLARIRPPAG